MRERCGGRKGGREGVNKAWEKGWYACLLVSSELIHIQLYFGLTKLGYFCSWWLLHFSSQ